jgi:hypothetical protein
MLTRATSSLPLAGEAFAAVWNSDNDRALALLHNVDAPGCAVMRARVWLRLERFDRVLLEYERRWLAAYQPAEATGLACCAAVAFAARGDVSAAWDAHAAAEASAKRVSDPLLHLHVAFTVALLHLMTGDVARSRHAIALLAASAETLPHIEARTPYQWELPHLRARILQQRGRHYELEHDRVAGERCYTSALRAAEDARNRDRYLEAQLLALLATVISETPADESRAYVVARANVAWSSQLDQSTTFVRHALVNNHRLFGSRTAVESRIPRGAPSLAARLDDRVHALLLEDWPDPVTFYAECRFAISLALDVDWSRTAEHEVLALARLSAVLAPFEYTFAKTIAQTYTARIEQLSPNCATRRNPNRPVHEMLRDACLAKAGGELDDAATIFGRVAKESHERGVPWRAAIAGLERYAMTRDERDLATARVFANAYPASSFSRRLRRSVAAALAGERAFAYLGISGPDARLGPR